MVYLYMICWNCGLYSIGLPAIIAFTASSIALNGTMNHSLGWRPSTVTCSLTPSNSLCINASNVEGVHIISSKAVGLMYDRQFDDTIVSSNFVSVDFRKMRTDSFQKIRTTRFRKIRVVRWFVNNEFCSEILKKEHGCLF